MTEPLLALDGLRLSPEGRQLSLELAPGDAYAVVGRRGAGVHAFLEAVADGRHGSVVTAAKVTVARPPTGRRTTPQSIAVGARGENDEAATQLLALGLWDERQTPTGQLGPSAAHALALLAAVNGDAHVLVLDHTLDALDPWALDGALGIIAAERGRGRAFLVATVRPSVVEALGAVIVMAAGSPVFAGSVEDLVRSAGPVELVVETDEAEAVRQMVEPFCLEARPAKGGLLLRAENGQALAARLLMEGYGSVKTVVLRAPTVAEALARLG